jgi:hypothetical protein
MKPSRDCAIEELFLCGKTISQVRAHASEGICALLEDPAKPR